MSNPTRQLHLNAFLLGVGHHLAAWRHPDARTSVTLDHYKDLARTAERGKFDALFFADYLGVAPAPARLLAQSALSLSSFFEPITLLSVLSTVTERLGLIGTVSTTYDSPFHLARRFASLDRLSGGRSGWNLVTSATDAEAKNFGLDGQIAHADRYARAREYVELVRELWDSWEDDAFIFDKEEARVFVPEKLHVPNHQGKYFSVAGPLNVERPVQGYPVLIQAGSSADGQELAAATAEIVFTAQPTLQEAQRFYRGLKALLPKFGRQPEDLLILPGVSPYIGRTEEEAREKFESLQALIPPEVGVGLLSA
ncbi:MAG TPA: NtaA/DmoA family FMN-dependent monooxygenase, partial [Candidatus Methylacidiphilales bacterium]